VPDYPGVEQVIYADIVLTPTERDEFRHEEIVVRSVVNQTQQTMRVDVFARIHGVGEIQIASRVIFTTAPKPDPVPDFNGDNTWERDDRPDE
jgi:hypothetical protein